MKKSTLMIAFLIGLTFSLTYGNTFSHINYDVFGVHSVSIENAIMEQELELEDWMLELLIINPPIEQKIELEDWMIDMDEFYNGDQIQEEQPELENWMLKSPFKQESGEQKLTLENWMFCFS